ncbi:putative membrane protein [Phyllobacterium trifolii]|uniref:Putative membrane protein n=1 Tax=Phyllobacterium trifolii TaxID=300193 RepID=A0A839U0G6_9HYPH|nr:hypothetical protein [Phyllobacterium trifolii]MBB3143927.1 putative membrane protein [Phyllobacterium trifolii]
MTFEPPHINKLSRTNWTKEFLCFLFVVIVLALGFEPGFQLIRELMVGERFSAWATLAAAAIGFTAVAFQTRRGFEHLIEKKPS